MLREVVKVRDARHGKFWVHFDCGHRALMDDRRTKRKLIWPTFNTECPFCLDFSELITGDMLEVYFSFCPYVAAIAEYYGDMVDDTILLILDGQAEHFHKWEIVRFRKI